MEAALFHFHGRVQPSNKSIHLKPTASMKQESFSHEIPYVDVTTAEIVSLSLPTAPPDYVQLSSASDPDFEKGVPS